MAANNRAAFFINKRVHFKGILKKVQFYVYKDIKVSYNKSIV